MEYFELDERHDESRARDGAKSDRQTILEQAGFIGDESTR